LDLNPKPKCCPETTRGSYCNEENLSSISVYYQKTLYPQKFGKQNSIRDMFSAVETRTAGALL